MMEAISRDDKLAAARRKLDNFKKKKKGNVPGVNSSPTNSEAVEDTTSPINPSVYNNNSTNAWPHNPNHNNTEYTNSDQLNTTHSTEEIGRAYYSTDDQTALLKNKLEAQKQTIDLLVDEKSELVNIQSKLTTHLQVLSQQVKDTLNENESLQENIKTLQSQLDSKHTNQLDTNNSKVQDAGGSESENLQLREKVKTLVDLNRKLAAENDSLKQSNGSGNLQNTENSQQPAHHQISNSDDIEHLHSTIGDLQATIQKQNESIDSTYLELSETKSKLAEVEQENIALAAEMVQHISPSGETDHKAVIGALEQQLNQANETISEHLNAQSVLQDELSALKGQRDGLHSKLDQLEQVRQTWLNEIQDKKRLSDLLSDASEKVARLSKENGDMLSALEELRTKHIEIFEEKVKLVEQNEFYQGKIIRLQQEVESIEVYRDEVDRLKDMLREQNSSENGSPADIEKKLVIARRESDVIIEKWKSSEDKVVNGEIRIEELEKQLGDLRATKKELEDAIQPLQQEISEYNAKLKDLHEENQKLEIDNRNNRVGFLKNKEELELSKRELELIRALWKHEKMAIEGEAPQRTEQESSQGGKNSETTSPLSPVAQVDSVIVNEIENMRSTQSQLNAEITLLKEKNFQVLRELEEERKLNVLLTAEVDSLPDYIFMYHQERKALLKQMDRMMQKIRKQVGIGGIPDMKNIIWDSQASMKLEEEAIVEDDGYQKAMVDKVQQGAVGGLVLRGSVEEVGRCRHCKGEEIII